MPLGYLDAGDIWWGIVLIVVVVVIFGGVSRWR
jgi:hypothetical protein